MPDDSELSEVLKSEDEIGKVIRTHLYLENILNNFLETALPNPQHLKPIQLDFFGKVQLALCLGLPDKFKKPLNYMGLVRNNFAHKLYIRVGKSEVNNFFDTFSNEQKEEIINTASMPSLSWVSDGKTWKSIEPSSRFMVMCFALYYGLKIALIEFETEKKTSEHLKRIGKYSLE